VAAAGAVSRIHSLDFLTPHEVIHDCVRLAAIPSLAAGVVGGITWLVMTLMGESAESEVAYALLMPFWFSGLYGNVVIYNVRWKHGVRVLRGHWWYRLTGLAIAWTLGMAVLGQLVNAALIYWGALDRDMPSATDAALFLLGSTAVAAFFALLPAKEQLVT
jgi:hypothetical protein